MAYTIQKKIFFECIQKAYPIIPSKSSLQILLNLKLTFQPDNLEIVATDLDHSIKIKTPITGDGEHEITVNAKKLFEIVRELHEGELTIDFDENVLIIESGGSFSCKISGADTRDFPPFPEIDDFNHIEISVANLKDMIVKSSFAVSRDEARACLCGVLWLVNKERTGMIATDGHRLGSSFCNGAFNPEEGLSSIVSPKSLIHLVKILEVENQDTSIDISIGEKYILFSNETMTLCSKLIEGPYPDYEKVIPKNNPKKAIIDKGNLLEAVKRVSVLSNQKTHLVKFVFKENELETVVQNRDIGGEARQVIPVEYEGEEHIIGFNAAYLIEILNIIKTTSITLEMNTQISACLIFPSYEKEEDKKSEDLFLIMPLRILEDA